MPSSKKIISAVCSDCKTSFEIKQCTLLERNRNNVPILCPNCMNIRKSNSIKSFHFNMDSNKRKMISLRKSESGKKYWENISSDKVKMRSDKIKKSIQSMSEEERKLRMDKIIDGNRKYWDNLSREKREMLKGQRMANISRHLEKMETDEEYRNIIKDKLSKSQKLIWNLKTDEERMESLAKLLNGYQSWMSSLSDEERYEWRENVNKYWNSLSDTQSQELSKRMSVTATNYWNSLDYDQRIAKISKIVKLSGGKNKLHDKFENQFNQSYISNTFYYIPETITNTTVIHSWDYGIYDKKTNDLVMVIDLDGSYYHADECDYSGIRSHEEYDERRFVSAPDGVKCHVIYEHLFSQSFDEMIHLLIKNYEEFLEDQFQICRQIGFPYPAYNDSELLKSWNQLLKLDPNSVKLSIRNREGDRIINHFHPSIYHASVGKKVSPYDAWYDDDILKKVIKNRIIYVNILNPNKILQGFNISKIAPKVSVFSAGRAKIIIHKYLNDMNEIFDPFSGFSGRMLGTISLGKRYIGQDISDTHIKESNCIYDFLHQHFPSLNVQLQNVDILRSKGEYESLFTCPPYGDKESWHYIDPSKMLCDDWIDECLKRFKCKRYVFVVDHTEKYKDHIVDEIINKSHFGSNSEYVVMIDRGI